MPRFVALLRAINAGGGRTVKMDSLRKAFESLGFSNVETFIASGNVIFETKSPNAKALEHKIENKLNKALRISVDTFVRTETELGKIANYKPFPSARVKAGDESNVIFLADRLDAKSKQRVTALKTDTDEFRVRGREIYWLRHRKRGRLLYSTVPLDKVLGKPFTVRGSRTVKKMADKLSRGV